TIIERALSYLYTNDNGTNEVIFNDRYYGEHVSGEKYPWCAAFVYCIFEECGASDLFYDGKKTAYCPAIHEWGKKRNLIVPTSEGQYGDIVLFDWNGDGVADHVGFIITRNGNGTYETVEGNTSTYNYTNGGYVLKMTRYYSSIIAIIRPQYDSGESKGENMADKKFVIDVSQHQGTIDWDKVKDKIAGAIIRCGYGDDLPAQDDTQFARNLSECERLGIPHGVYLYSYAGTEVQAKSELAHILRLIKGHDFQLPIFLDVEESNLTLFAQRACRVVCEGLESAGFTPGVYSSLSWWNNYLTEIKEYTRWVAHWNPTCGYTGDYLIWQYGTEKVDGINGEVDANYYYGDFGKADNTITFDDTKTTPKTTITETTPDITYQVFTDTSGWLPVVRNLEDYAGIDGQPIKGIRVYLNGDTLAVQTHQLANGNIDKLTIFAGKNTIRYRVRVIGASDYYSWMENKKDTGGSSDTFAGEAGKAIDRVQIVVK
ncbi:MAG: CHAP domain-containing protein, partial [Clostridia bacterium]|nr:CHAP domain-containing protein [Clostridia bacterium]